MSSRARPFALAVAYIMAVKKDIGLKRPEIQSEVGVISSSEYSTNC
jgi:hypothetical protein